jgi:hypothetical protein
MLRWEALDFTGAFSISTPSTSAVVSVTLTLRRRKSMAPTRRPATSDQRRPTIPARKIIGRYSTGTDPANSLSCSAVRKRGLARPTSGRRMPRTGLRAITSASTARLITPENTPRWVRTVLAASGLLVMASTTRRTSPGVIDPTCRCPQGR